MPGIAAAGATEAIILHRDAAFRGSYFTVGTVISADMDFVGQLQPHTPTRFIKMTMEEALTARAERAALLDRIRSVFA